MDSRPSADLRDLARGIYPPLLADQGLVPALQAQARRASVPVEIHADGIGRYPQDTEAAVYFCTLEALQNIAKYASASRAKVGMADRRAALGGDLQVRSQPGQGTILSGELPLPRLVMTENGAQGGSRDAIAAPSG